MTVMSIAGILNLIPALQVARIPSGPPPPQFLDRCALASQPRMDDASYARFLLLALSFCWGLSWSAMRIALDEVSPWTVRFLGYSIGAATLLALLKMQGRDLAIPRGRAWLHVIIAS